ncbi:MAG: DNA polymerase, partial [Acidimicrobiales bacterium]
VEVLSPVSAVEACTNLADLVRAGDGVTIASGAEVGLGAGAEAGAEAGTGGLALHLAWAGAPGRSDFLGLAITAGSPQVVWLSAELISHPGVAEALGRLLGPGAPEAVAAHRAKEAMRALAQAGIDFVALGTDTAIAAYLIDPAGGQYLLDDLVPRYLSLSLDAPDGPAPGELDLEGRGNDVAEATARRARAVSLLAAPLGAALASDGMEDLYRQIERPLVRVLARMENVGVGVDKAYLSDLAEELGAEVASLDTEIQALAGEPFKVNSTPQLRHILFDKLGLIPQKRTKTGFSTDAASLERLRDEHPIIERLLRYREVEKLRSTYGASLLAEIAPDGRIHASFNQTVARTGRLSSESPNLHNIPIRSEEGRRFRRAFVAAPGHRLLVADYNQVELRVIAHLSGDPGLVEAFGAGVDIHTATAARLFGTEPADVTLSQRSKSKMVSYGLAYGMEAYGLSQRLGVPVEEAAVILAAYFEAFPKVRAYMDATVAEARARGYTETLFGRRRPIPELTSTNFRVRQAGERQAMNAGIQGLAADLFKVALVRLDHALTAAGCSARLILQVHDEVLVEVPPSEEEMVEEMTREAMTGACALDVPLEVNLSWGQSWADAKS